LGLGPHKKEKPNSPWAPKPPKCEEKKKRKCNHPGKKGPQQTKKAQTKGVKVSLPPRFPKGTL